MSWGTCQIRQELAQRDATLREVTAELRSKEAQVERLQLELAALKEVVESRAAQKWTDTTLLQRETQLKSGRLQKDHPLHQEVFRSAKLDVYLSLDKKERSKVSISAFVYVYLDGDVNMEQLCTLSKAETPPDPAVVLYTHRRHLRDIDSKRPLFTEMMVSIPEDSPQHVTDRVSSGYRVGTQICFEGEPLKKKKNRLQFNIKECDKVLITLGVTSVVKKRFFRFLARIFYLEICTWTQFLAAISEKKTRRPRPDFVGTHESKNKQASCFFFPAVRSQSGFPYQALMTRCFSLFQTETLSSSIIGSTSKLVCFEEAGEVFAILGSTYNSAYATDSRRRGGDGPDCREYMYM